MLGNRSMEVVPNENVASAADWLTDQGVGINTIIDCL